MRVLKKGTVYQLSFLTNLFPVNCYLVEEENGLTLVDAALPFSAKKILETVNRIGKPLKHIVLTHAHQDHIGALDFIKASHPGAEVSLSHRDALLLDGKTELLPGEPNTPIRGGIPKGITTRPDTLLAEGDRIGFLEVIYTPGHTPGSISLFDTRNGSLIAGDAFQTRGGIAVSGTMRPLFPFPAMATWNKIVALQSAKKILGYTPSLLATGHGNMLVNPSQHISFAIKQSEQKLQLA
ncbi:MBL fold metallo-hydrolase [Peribacillus sp. SCS-155]|uniref:MBL fold metallo-hydrolase n=1 Tax=Peribacillus sedimenti TaxID=3115297 RepID=UPI003906D334